MSKQRKGSGEKAFLATWVLRCQQFLISRTRLLELLVVSLVPTYLVLSSGGGGGWYWKEKSGNSSVVSGFQF